MPNREERRLLRQYRRQQVLCRFLSHDREGFHSHMIEGYLRSFTWFWNPHIDIARLSERSKLSVYFYDDLPRVRDDSLAEMVVDRRAVVDIRAQNRTIYENESLLGLWSPPGERFQMDLLKRYGVRNGSRHVA